MGASYKAIPAFMRTTFLKRFNDKVLYLIESQQRGYVQLSTLRIQEFTIEIGVHLGNIVFLDSVNVKVNGVECATNSKIMFDLFHYSTMSKLTPRLAWYNSLSKPVKTEIKRQLQTT